MSLVVFYIKVCNVFRCSYYRTHIWACRRPTEKKYRALLVEPFAGNISLSKIICQSHKLRSWTLLILLNFCFWNVFRQIILLWSSLCGFGLKCRKSCSISLYQHFLSVSVKFTWGSISRLWIWRSRFSIEIKYGQSLFVLFKIFFIYSNIYYNWLFFIDESLI